MANDNSSTGANDEGREPEGATSAIHEAIAYQFNTDQVRTVRIGDKVWFAASDVCDILGLDNVSQALSRLLPDERSFAGLFSAGQTRQTAMVDESGLITLVLSSRKPEAVTFRRWITKEVLPSIWKTSSYTAPNTDPAIEHSDIADIINRRAGIYIVIVNGEQRTMQHTNGGGEIITLVTEAMSSMMAGSLISAEGGLKLMLSQTMFPGLDTRFELESLERVLAYGAGVARRYIATAHNRTAKSEIPPVGLPH